jgi:multiple sugar transport system permease protein
MVICSLKTKIDILTIPPNWLFIPTLDNYIGLFERLNFTKELINSVFMSVSAVVIAVIVSFLAAYSFSRFKPKGTDFLMFLLLSMRMVPAAAVVVPVYLLYSAAGWKGTYTGMILFYAMFSIPFSVWILKGFIDGVSQRFDETALVNGGSRIHIIFQVIMPQVKPGLIAAFIFNIIFVWNEFIFNYIIGGKSTATVPVGLAQGFTVGGTVQWDFVAALTTFYSFPLVVFIYFFQKYLLVGMTFGTVRGEV